MADWTPRIQAKTYGEVRDAGIRARATVGAMRALDGPVRDKAILVLADGLVRRLDGVLEANAEDVRAAREAELPGEAVGQLRLTREQLEELALELRSLARLPDPLAQVIEGSRSRSGVERARMRAPIGVVGVIHKAQPAFVPQAVGMMLKTSNVLLLHDSGGAAANTDAALSGVVSEALGAAGLPGGAIQLIPHTHRQAIRYLVTAHEQVDLVLPLLPGGIPLNIRPDALVPVVSLDGGGCHVYVDATADLDLAVRVVLDSKAGWASRRHTATAVLVHEDIARRLVPRLREALAEHDVTLRGEPRFAALAPDCPVLEESEWRATGPAPVLRGAVVESLDEALAHIHQYGTGHTETVVSGDMNVVRRFCAAVDATAVTVNTPSTETDPSHNPLEPSLGFSCQRLRPRGPLGFTELTTTKWLIWPTEPTADPG